VVRAEGTAYGYPQDGRGLRSTSLAVRAGETVHVSGASGCGKSTLARCLTGLIPHLYRGQLSGQVWLDGLRTTQAPLWQLAGRAGLVFQNPAAQMLAQSVEGEIVFGLENLGLPRDVIRQRLESALARFGLEPLRSRSPQTLSGGEQQKLALAAIMARQPPVLVLDEPLSMLDSSAAAELVAYLERLARSGVAVVVCEHRAEYLSALAGLRTLHLAGGQQPGDTDPQTPAPLSNSPPFRLEVAGLGVQFGARVILQDLGFAADGGQVIAIVGRNGVGKTTLLRALTGLQQHSGAASAGGGRPEFGLVFQNADLQLFNASVRDEILYRLPQPDMVYYAWLLQTLGLSLYEHTPPLLLSEGEKRRVALATALMRRPRHGLLLDEPALGQDAVHKARLVYLAHALAETGRLVILTTHDLNLAAQADRLLLLGPGGFVADGPPAQVLRDQAAWEQLGLFVPEWVKV
jgi:energy-coupling factor transport system ATP-binding protein